METRLRKLEKTVAQQGYLILIMVALLPFVGGAILLLWNVQGVPRFDHIGVSLTLFQTLFGIAALYGFWALRGLTKETAEEVAEREVRDMVPPLVARITQESLQALGPDPMSDDDISNIVGVTGREEGHGK